MDILKKCATIKMTPPEIKVLPEEVANRIAAGEVIERPAAAVKELLENSVDAGATRVDVEFKHGGKSFIKIADNGCGMTREQMLLSLHPHATSKIKKAEDLFSISSYGFRGEAVPSIASVSKFSMSSRPESQNFGTRIDVFAGEVGKIAECGMASGTEIVVENLFCSVPARRKFLKSDNVEASHILKLCRLYALALPDISISLVENSRVLFRSERGLPLQERIARVCGREISEKLVPIDECQSSQIRLRGAVLKAGESFATNRNICAFINSRPVESRAVYSALKEAYAQFLPKGRYAAAFLFIDMDPASVDVNVHPAKREVRLKDEFAVRDFLCEQISRTLSRHSDSYRSEFFPDSPALRAGRQDKFPPLGKREINRAPEAVLKPAFTPAESPAHNGADIRQESASNCESDTREAKKAPENSPISMLQRDAKKIFEQYPPLAAQDAQAPISPTPRKARLPDWRYIGCFDRRYALFESAKGLVLMSISSALRRVKYSRIMESMGNAEKKSQMLLMPISLKLDRGDSEYFEANAQYFAACGFEIENFGRDFYKITAIPDWMKIGDAENFVRDFVSLARDEGRGMKKKRVSDELFARMAVSRMGAGFECNELSATALLSELLECPGHISSPDGIPTLKELPMGDISKLFKGGS